MRGRPLWEYWDGHEHFPIVEPPIKENSTGGSTYFCYWDEDTESHNLVAKEKTQDPAGLFVETDFVNFVVKLQDKLGDRHIVEVRSQHKRNGEIFRSHTQFHGGVWRDWVMVDWDDEDVPAKVWGFVDLSKMSEESGVNYGGVAKLEPAVYAIVEYAEDKEEEEGGNLHNLFTPLVKKVSRIRGGAVTRLSFWLVDVEAFLHPITVVPDIGGKPNEYIMVKTREDWKDDFEEWLLNSDVPDVTVSDDESTDDDYDGGSSGPEDAREDEWDLEESESEEEDRELE